MNKHLPVGPQRTFSGANLSEIAFPLGGIGTGTISLGGRGNLRDFEIQNHPAKGRQIACTFFALWAKAAGQPPVARVLEGRLQPPFREAGGELPDKLAGLPRFRDVSFTGEYPVATVKLSDADVPVRASLNAWNPFIPLNVHDSALPAAIFEWTFTNDGDAPVEIALAASMGNPLMAVTAEGGVTDFGSLIQPFSKGSTQGLFYSHPDATPKDASTGTLALATTWGETRIHPQWYRGGWFDRFHFFWDSFAATGTAPDINYNNPSSGHGDIGSLILRATVPPHGSVTLPVTLAWHFPRMRNPWTDDAEDAPAILDTYVAAHFSDAQAVTEYIHRDFDRLKRQTGTWRETIFGSTLPAVVLEAVTSQASIIRTSTCFLLADGSFFGWEGTWPNAGSCHGSCTHVWNYEQALAFLFPELERSMRRTEFLCNTRASGNMAFRTNLPPGLKLWSFKPCVDGQMGTIIQAYRDWQLSGDDAFLRELWPAMKRALEYAWTMTPGAMEQGEGHSGDLPTQLKRSIDSLWDPDKDGLMEGEQHNTYDIEFYGPNTMCTAMYLGALRASERIARYFGQLDKADEYHAVAISGRAKVERLLWNGEYYIQLVEVINGVDVPEQLESPVGIDDNTALAMVGDASATQAIVPKYQYGDGCLSDQLIGQWAAHVAGLGYLLDETQVRAAVHSIFRYNYRPAVGVDANVQRVYAVGDEPGLLLCSWPHGDRPALPFVYSDEVWTGIEYQVAAHLIYEGLVDEGLTIVQAVAERYSGYNRNPWNQIECGNQYARAMASWSVKLALDGFTYSAPERRLGFAPKINPRDFRTFWSTGTAWGEYRQNLNEGRFELIVLYGCQTIQHLDLRDLPRDGELKALVGNNQIPAVYSPSGVTLNQPATLNPDDLLRIFVTVAA